MQDNQIIELKTASLEKQKKELPSHLLEMGLNMLYKEPINLEDLFIGDGLTEILEINKFGLDIEYKIESGIKAVIVNSDNVFLGGSYDNISLAKESLNVAVIARDYFLEEYQVYLSRIYQADGIILNTNLVSDEMLEKISLLSLAMGMEPIYTIASKSNLKRLEKFDFAKVFLFEDANVLDHIDTTKINIFYDRDKDKLVSVGGGIFIRSLI